jgi:hypothetical protein
MTWRIVLATSPRLAWPSSWEARGRVHHAVVQVIGEQPDCHFLQGPGHRGDLDHHVGG